MGKGSARRVPGGKVEAVVVESAVSSLPSAAAANLKIVLYNLRRDHKVPHYVVSAALLLMGGSYVRAASLASPTALWN